MTKQREMMRSIFQRHAEAICKEYAAAEDRGEVGRESDENDLSSGEYAKKLFYDGIEKGWISK